MKFRVALVTVLFAGLAASFAVAAPAKTPKNQTATDTTATTTTARTFRSGSAIPACWS